VTRIRMDETAVSTRVVGSLVALGVVVVHIRVQGGITNSERFREGSRAIPRGRHRPPADPTVRQPEPIFTIATKESHMITTNSGTAPRRLLVSLSLLAAAAATLSACSSGSGSSKSSSAAPSASAPSSAAAATTGAAAPAGGNSITAVETDFHIQLSSTKLKAGTYSIQVKNSGAVTHALSVDGPGVSDKSTSTIAPGASATLTVTLKAGSYDIFCPVANHKAMGMDEHVTVS
jgi:uncharacterized cupredoxin-like copper-binding protein